MKITDSQVIREGEKELINAVKDQIDPDRIRDLIAHKLSGGNLKARDGQIVIHNNQIAFRLDFELQFTGSILLDREGNLLSDDMEDEDGVAEPSEVEETFEEGLVEGELEPEEVGTEEGLQEELTELSDTDFEDAALDEIHDGDEEELLELDEEESLVESPDSLDSESIMADDEKDDESELSESVDESTDEVESSEDLDEDDEDIDEILSDNPEIADKDPDLDWQEDDILPEKDSDTHGNEDLLDDDINEILKETRSYWKQNRKEE